MLKLQVEKRDILRRAGTRLRGEGKIPAVFYGPKEKSVPISVPLRDFTKVWHEAGESSVIELAGVGEPKEALIHEVTVDAVSGEPQHADFYVIEKGKKIRVSVPLEFEGVAPAEKEKGGTVVKVLHEVEVEVMPKDLPRYLAVDVSSLTDLDSQIHVSDLALPSGVEMLTASDEVVAAVAEVKEEEETIPEEVDLSSIEVEKKGKQEEGEAETAPEGTAEESPQ